MNQLIADMNFAKENADEFGYRLCPMLRYVAALNPEATKTEFVEAMIQFGVNTKTAAIQYAASRKFDRENG